MKNFTLKFLLLTAVFFLVGQDFLSAQSTGPVLDIYTTTVDGEKEESSIVNKSNLRAYFSVFLHEGREYKNLKGKFSLHKDVFLPKIIFSRLESADSISGPVLEGDYNVYTVHYKRSFQAGVSALPFMGTIASAVHNNFLDMKIALEYEDENGILQRKEQQNSRIKSHTRLMTGDEGNYHCSYTKVKDDGVTLDETEEHSFGLRYYYPGDEIRDSRDLRFSVKLPENLIYVPVEESFVKWTYNPSSRMLQVVISSDDLQELSYDDRVYTLSFTAKFKAGTKLDADSRISFGFSTTCNVFKNSDGSFDESRRAAFAPKKCFGYWEYDDESWRYDLNNELFIKSRKIYHDQYDFNVNGKINESYLGTLTAYVDISPFRRSYKENISNVPDSLLPLPMPEIKLKHINLRLNKSSSEVSDETFLFSKNVDFQIFNVTNEQKGMLLKNKLYGINKAGEATLIATDMIPFQKINIGDNKYTNIKLIFDEPVPLYYQDMQDGSFTNVHLNSDLYFNPDYKLDCSIYRFKFYAESEVGCFDETKGNEIALFDTKSPTTFSYYRVDWDIKAISNFEFFLSRREEELQKSRSLVIDFSEVIHTSWHSSQKDSHLTLLRPSVSVLYPSALLFEGVESSIMDGFDFTYNIQEAFKPGQNMLTVSYDGNLSVETLMNLKLRFRASNLLKSAKHALYVWMNVENEHENCFDPYYTRINGNQHLMDAEIAAYLPNSFITNQASFVYRSPQEFSLESFVAEADGSKLMTHYHIFPDETDFSLVLRFSNQTTEGLENLSLINVLPHINDKKMHDNTPRGSQFAVELRSEVSGIDKTKYDVFYSEEMPAKTYAENLSKTTWKNEFTPAAKMIKIVLKSGQTLVKGTTEEFVLPVKKTAADLPVGLKAVNSFSVNSSMSGEIESSLAVAEITSYKLKGVVFRDVMKHGYLTAAGGGISNYQLSLKRADGAGEELTTQTDASGNYSFDIKDLSKHILSLRLVDCDLPFALERKMPGYTVSNMESAEKSFTPIRSQKEYVINAGLAKKYAITYNGNGFTDGAEPAVSSCAEELIVKDKGTMEKNDGLYPDFFLGWSERADAVSAQHKPGDKISPQKDLTLYAIWSKTSASGEPVREIKGRVNLKESSSSSASLVDPVPAFKLTLTKGGDADFQPIETQNDVLGNYSFEITESGIYFLHVELPFYIGFDENTYVFLKENTLLVSVNEEDVKTEVNIPLLKDRYLISYNGNGNTDGLGVQEEYSPREAYKFTCKDNLWPFKKETVEAKYQFMGWAYDASAKIPDVLPGQEVYFNYKDAMLYAVWQKLAGDGSLTRILTGTVFFDTYSYGYTIRDIRYFKPLSNYQLTLTKGEYSVSTQSDALGRYFFEDLPGTGNYVLTVAMKEEEGATKLLEPYVKDTEYRFYNHITARNHPFEIKQEDYTTTINAGIRHEKVKYVYHGNGHSSGDEPSPSVIEPDTKLTLKDAGNLKRELDGVKYGFMGWAKNPDAKNVEYKPGKEITSQSVPGIVDLYAVWGKLAPSGEFVGQLEGYVYRGSSYISFSEKEKFLQGYKIRLRKQGDSSPEQEAVTDENGYYSFDILSDVDYSVSIDLNSTDKISSLYSTSAKDDERWCYNNFVGPMVKFKLGADEGSLLKRLNAGLTERTDFYTLTYHGNGNSTGTAPSLEGKHGFVEIAGSNGMTKTTEDGAIYGFLGWSTMPMGEKEYEEKDRIELSKDLNLYAVWGLMDSDGNFLHSIKGTVIRDPYKYGHGPPGSALHLLSNRKLTLTKSDGSVSKEAYSGTDGIYSFDNVPIGIYSLKIEINEYEQHGILYNGKADNKDTDSRIFNHITDLGATVEIKSLDYLKILNAGLSSDSYEVVYHSGGADTGNLPANQVAEKNTKLVLGNAANLEKTEGTQKYRAAGWVRDLDATVPAFDFDEEIKIRQDMDLYPFWAKLNAEGDFDRSIKGKVYRDQYNHGNSYLSNFHPLAAYKLTLSSSDAGFEDRELVSAVDGSYFFDNLPVGTYILKVEMLELERAASLYNDLPNNKDDEWKIYNHITGEETTIVIKPTDVVKIVNAGIFIYGYKVVYHADGASLVDLPEEKIVEKVNQRLVLADGAKMEKTVGSQRYRSVGWDVKPGAALGPKHQFGKEISVDSDLDLYPVWAKIDADGEFERLIKGRVYRDSGNYGYVPLSNHSRFLAGYKLTLSSSDANFADRELISDADGAYSFENLPVGTYTLKIEMKEYEQTAALYGNNPDNKDNEWTLYNHFSSEEITIEIVSTDVVKFVNAGLYNHKYRIVYHANGATEGNPPETKFYDRKSAVTASDEGDLKKEVAGVKYMFMGWALDSTAITPVYRPGDLVANPGSVLNLDLYAVWHQLDAYGNPLPYLQGFVYRSTLDGWLSRSRLSSNGLSGYKITLATKDGAFVADAITGENGLYSLLLPAKGTYTVTVGLKAHDKIGPLYGNNANNLDDGSYIYNHFTSPTRVFEVEEGVVIKHMNAELERVKFFSVSYDGNGNTEGVAPAKQENQGRITVAGVEDMKKETDGKVYALDGWSIIANGEKAYEPGDNVELEEDLLLYAVWIEKKVTGVLTIKESVEISAYPNPVESMLYISADKKIDKIELYSLTGMLILTENNITLNKHELDLSSLYAGVYLLKVHSREGVALVKILKK